MSLWDASIGGNLRRRGAPKTDRRKTQDLIDRLKVPKAWAATAVKGKNRAPRREDEGRRRRCQTETSRRHTIFCGVVSWSKAGRDKIEYGARELGRATARVLEECWPATFSFRTGDHIACAAVKVEFH